MNARLMHRGPDDEGSFVAPGVGLAVRRLSIIDVAGGHQPISNEEGTVSVVFNGEIYNYQVLREELQRKGHQLRTQSDTEVIPHLYEEYGAACVERLDGMFAFALLDQSKQAGSRLLLARDPLGKKPLYYADLGGALLFASEIKPLLEDPRVRRDLDFTALHHYLSLLMIPAPYCIFKSIRKLPAGCVLECDAHGVQVRRYWDYLSFVRDRHPSEQEAIEETRRLLFAAVEKRLISEVPLGAFLSGGLDSSTVVAIMSRIKAEPVNTFSIGFEGPETHNELPFARQLAKHCRTNHHEIVVKPDIVETLHEVVRYADEPFAISSAIPMLLMARAARAHMTVVLTGDGGDEVFGGYEHYAYERWAEIYRRFPALVDDVLAASVSPLPGRVDRTLGRVRSRVLRFAGNARSGAGQRRLGWQSGFTEEEKHTLYAPMVREMPRAGSTGLFLEEATRNGNTASITRQNAMDMVVWLADEMLTKVDRMTMAASVEARCPLLDRQLVQYLAAIGFDMKAPGWRRGHLKPLLRRAVADLLPAELLERPKHGFNVPLDAWFRGGARTFLTSMLSPERIERRGLFDPQSVAALLARHQAGSVNASNRLYALLVFEVWAESYL
jgi:asparagine synthase (glutamine-hydrolysing)